MKISAFMFSLIVSFVSAAQADMPLTNMKAACDLWVHPEKVKSNAQTMAVGLCQGYILAVFEQLILGGDIDPAQRSICLPAGGATPDDFKEIARGILAEPGGFQAFGELNKLPEGKDIGTRASMTVMGAVLLKWPCNK